MLSPLSSPRQYRRIITIDLEWWSQTNEFRMAGVYEPEGGYRCYTDLSKLWLEEFNSENSGAWFYAHNGGKSDIHFLVQARDTDPRLSSYSADAAFSGGSAVIVVLRRGSRRWKIIDSLWTLRTKLADIGRWIGLPKMEGYLDGPDDIMRAANERDCRILYEAMETVQQEIFAAGGELKATIGSTAMTLFRREFLNQSFAISRSVNADARRSYFSSRVEIFNYQIRKPARTYDVNSMFVSAMQNPLPGRYLGMRRDIPSEGYYIAECEIEVPERYLPPLPVRLRGRVFFPIGRLRGWFTKTDIEAAVKRGAILHSVSRVMTFETFTDLGDFARHVYDRRLKGSSESERELFKRLGNSCYGKFSENRKKKRAIFGADNSAGELVRPGIVLRTVMATIPHMAVPISTAIVSLARENLLAWDDLTLERGGILYYNDTDSDTTDIELPCSDDLGALKLEYEIDEGLYLLPKLYWYRLKEGSKAAVKMGTRELVRAKGFSRLTPEGFFTLRGGGTVIVERMKNMWENARRGIIAPITYRGEKGLTGSLRPKRCLVGESETRPWTMAELEQDR